MNTILLRGALVALLLVPRAVAAEPKLDIHNGIPPAAHMAVYGQHNPERDYQRAYMKQVWEAIHNEKLPERVFAFMMDLLPNKSKDTATSISDELRTIADPVDWSALGQSPEVAYGQVMELPQTQHLVLVRLPSEDAATKIESALKNVSEMVVRRTNGAAVAADEKVESATLQTLAASKIKDFPFQLAFARVGDVILVSTSAKVGRESLHTLFDGGPSKFDDPRLQAALKQLPKAEDGLAFYDARQQFRQLKDLGNFIREKAPKDAKAARVAGMIERLINEVAILDYQVTVASTEGQRNIRTELGQLTPDANEKMLYKVLASGKPFDDWQRWVPADAQAYSLNTGVNLHALYEWCMEFVRKEFPEAQPKLDKFEAKQKEWGIHIDRDILQAFSGECVGVKLPAAAPGVLGGQDTVVAFRCEKPDRIRELIQQGAKRLEANPVGQSQQVKFGPCKELEGFDELSCSTLIAFGVRPVVGFHEGWMIVASNSAAAQKVLQTLAGKSPSIDTTEQFAKFGLKIEGPVAAISYCDLAAKTGRAAMMIRQASLMAPAFVIGAGVKDEKKLKAIQDGLGLLPSIANVVEKYNFLEARLTVVQKGEAEGSFVKRSVTLVKAPKEK